MKRRFFLALLTSLLASAYAEAQEQQARPAIPADTFYWKQYPCIPKPSRADLRRIEVPRQQKRIREFLSANIGQFPQFRADSAGPFDTARITGCLHPAELNGDGRIDMIFMGFSGGQADITRIYLNFPDSFLLVFEDYQYPSELTVVKGILTSLTMTDPGCGDDYLYFDRAYQVRSDGPKLSFIKGKQTAVYMHTETPGTLFPNPVPFRSASDTLLVRASAAVINEPFNPTLENFGNITARYKTKIRGKVLGTSATPSGRDWWYVEIMPDTKPSASILYGTDRLPTFFRGWVHRDAIVTEKVPGEIPPVKKKSKR
jgi:hypothetical protein